MAECVPLWSGVCTVTTLKYFLLTIAVFSRYFGLFGREDLTELTHTTSSKVFSSSDLVYQSVS